jgi:hypothetical protein
LSSIRHPCSQAACLGRREAEAQFGSQPTRGATLQFQDGGRWFEHKVKRQKKRDLNNAHDGDMENKQKTRFVVMGGELVGKLMYMSNTYERLDRVREYRGRRVSRERGREYARTAAFRGV